MSKKPAWERTESNQALRKTKKFRCNILIVCEGEKTEPNYFKNFEVNHNDYFEYKVEAIGFGYNTLKLVEKAIEVKNDSTIEYDAVWVVFDKDDFPANNFNNAMHKAEANDISVAWSNEAFEIWYLLHFQNRITSMSRNDYEKAISKAVNEKLPYKEKGYKYKKNDIKNYSIISKYGNQNNAIKWASELVKSYVGNDYHTHNPCTTVHNLVNQLLDKDRNLKAKMTNKLEE